MNIEKNVINGLNNTIQLISHQRLTKMAIVCSIVFLELFAADAIAEEVLHNDASVDIYVEMPSGRFKQGSGFYFNNGPNIVTAYHVIKGAQKIKVITGNQIITDVKVSKVYKDYDMATLYLPNLKKSPAYFAVDSSSKVPSYKEEVYVIGHPRSSGRHYFKSYITSGKFVESTTINSKHGHQIFNKSIPVLTLDITNYSGMSGAPVIYNSRAIGVFSGSYDEGGALGWMIPIYFANKENSTSINKYPDEIQDWPKFDLMNPNFKDVMRSFNVERKANRILNTYLNNIENLNRFFNDRVTAAAKVQASASLLKLAAKDIRDEDALGKSIFVEYAQAVDNFGVVSNSIGASRIQLADSFTQIVNWYKNNESMNKTHKNTLEFSLDRIADSYPELNQDYYDSIGINEKFLPYLMKTITNVFSPGDFNNKRRMLKDLGARSEIEFSKMSSVDSIRYQSNFISQHRALGKLLIESLQYVEN